jgi:copper-(or silver)-translocating P-type ATPase/heavy metal-(Cd/Co/Hg/Pb/Zn)-translocating P-type ATPase
MSEKIIEIDLALVLPNISDDKDGCLARLETVLLGKKGIQQAHFHRDHDPITLCLHFDPAVLTLDDVNRLAKHAGAEIVNRYHHVLIPIKGMDCSDCTIVLEHSLGRMEGILAANVNYAAQKIQIEYDKNKVDLPKIERRIESLGYEIIRAGFRSWYKENHEVILSLLTGVLVLVGWLGGKLELFPGLLSTGLYIIAYIMGGWEVATHAWHALREGKFDTDLLMVMAAIGAAILGDLAEGALLLFMFSLGHALEERALDRARSAVSALADLAPKTAFVQRDGREFEVPVEQLELNDVVIVRPGVRMPIDGIILSGRSAVDQAPVTGESVPVDKNPGDQVYAGTVNGEGALKIQVTRLAKDSTLSRVMQMVEEAQTQKSPTQQTVEKFERVFVPIVLIATALVILLPPLFGVPFKVSFLRAMTLLVAASPCALALGTPAAILAGIGQAARNGVLIKGGVHLENLGSLNAIAFDKTGTITHGKPEVTDFCAIAPEFEADTLLALAAAVESQSGHPLAQAVVKYAQIKELPLPLVSDAVSLTGMGLRAKVDARQVLIGSAKMMEEANLTLSSEIEQKAEDFQSQGKTIMLIAVEEKIAGLLALADTIRPNAADTMAKLRALGVRETVMLTGDNSLVAEAIAGQAGLTDFRANLMPEEKLSAVRMLVAQYQQVAMVGDGVNDAPALANSTVGIAMGGAGTDVALETADVALMGDDLSKLPFAVGLGRATRRVITQNLVIALGVIAVLVTSSLAGWAGIGVAIVFHEGSTILVVLNALRLLGYKQRN